jgi:hypothetical protein
MRAKIEPNEHIRISLLYNEQKAVEGKAVRIAAENFLKDSGWLTHKEILDRFRQRSSFNDRHRDYGVHFMLNFGKVEKLGPGRLTEITGRYMCDMGFEDQPYVVYQHHDAGHTHVHIVACGVRADGSWCYLRPRNYLESHAICRKLEKEFSLEKSIRSTVADQPEFAVDHAQKVKYGEPGLKRSMSDVLNTVVDHYRYTSLDELNAILRQYNVEANPGLPESRLRKVGGLLYHALDDDGVRVGMPIKASLFHLKPTLPRIEQKMEENRSQRESERERIHTAIEWALAGRPPTWTGFLKDLEKEGIAVVASKRSEGGEGLFFVDHITKAAFSGESLGSAFGSEAIRNKCVQEEPIQQIYQQKNTLHL